MKTNQYTYISISPIPTNILRPFSYKPIPEMLWEQS